MKVLVTGGAGYIGSHFVRSLLEHGISVVVVDNLTAGRRSAVPGGVPFAQLDVGDRAAMGQLLAEHRPTAVVHFAGSIQVGESVRRPDLYYQNNVVQTLGLLGAVVDAGVKSFVFSSTAAVYGNPQSVPIVETHPTQPINAYGATKRVIEMALADYAKAFGLRVAALRYFNAAGAHPSGELGEHHAPETHLIPLVIDAATGRAPALTIFGDDWPTADGTCIRDYIHVQDLAEAHLLALRALEEEPVDGDLPLLTLNLGTGKGESVRQVVQTVESVMGRRVPLKIGARRDGDPPVLVAAVERARARLGWRAQRSELSILVEDAVRARGASQT